MSGKAIARASSGAMTFAEVFDTMTYQTELPPVEPAAGP